MASESSHQQAVIKWSQQPSVRERYPELALLHHIKNETKEGAAQVAVDKAMGVKKGVPDLHLPVARGGYHSLYIEMKNETGRANDAQNWWLERLSMEGNYTVVCHGWQSAVDILTWYLGLGEYRCAAEGKRSAEAVWRRYARSRRGVGSHFRWRHGRMQRVRRVL